MEVVAVGVFGDDSGGGGLLGGCSRRHGVGEKSACGFMWACTCLIRMGTGLSEEGGESRRYWCLRGASSTRNLLVVLVFEVEC